MSSPADASDASSLADAPLGLSSLEAATRLRLHGPNVLPQPERRRWPTIAFGVLREPMLLLLVAASTLYLLLGDPGEAALLGASVLLVILTTVYQEQRSEHALQALRDLSSPRARVLRDGVPVTVPGQDVVVGDVILVAEGDRIPADARVLDETDLHVDESMLTGESVAVHRQAQSGGTDDRLHASTLVVRGRGRAEVVATGSATAVGRIGASLQAIRPQATSLQIELRRVVFLFASLSAASCALVTGLYLVMRGGWLDSLLAGITLAMANIPEEFPVVLTVFLALGAWRMAQHRVLVRRAAAIEALGSITVLCTDKTGTLTRNHMALAEVFVDGEQGSPRDAGDPRLRVVLQTAIAASQPQSLDPMERALQEAMASMVAPDSPGAGPRHLREYPLSTSRPAVAHVWSVSERELLVACKGAPETVASLCRLTPARREAALAEVGLMAKRGLRVLAVASCAWPADDQATPLPEALEDFALQWVGLVAFADPLRSGVPEAVQEAAAAGIRIIMLTGDHAETARVIASQAGIGRPPRVGLGQELDSLGDEALAREISGVDVFARVRPEHKLRLVNSLKDSGEIVAMTGDGVNDAPALMASHVGIAMGARGTDVAREASAIVLLDDDFVSVIRAIRLGRAIYDNIQRASRYILAVHVPITGLALLPLFTGGPMVLLPLHVVFLELIIDPACTIVFERERPDDGIMRRPPREPGQPLLGARVLLGSLAQGGFMFAVLIAVYACGVSLALSAGQLGALAFTALVAGNLGLIVLYRSGDSLLATLGQPNAAFWIVAILALALLALVTLVDSAARWFGFAPPPPGAWSLALALPFLAALLLAGLERRLGAWRPSRGRST